MIEEMSGEGNSGGRRGGYGKQATERRGVRDRGGGEVGRGQAAPSVHLPDMPSAGISRERGGKLLVLQRGSSPRVVGQGPCHVRQGGAGGQHDVPAERPHPRLPPPQQTHRDSTSTRLSSTPLEHLLYCPSFTGLSAVSLSHALLLPICRPLIPCLCSPFFSALCRFSFPPARILTCVCWLPPLPCMR